MKNANFKCVEFIILLATIELFEIHKVGNNNKHNKKYN